MQAQRGSVSDVHECE